MNLNTARLTVRNDKAENGTTRNAVSGVVKQIICYRDPNLSEFMDLSFSDPLVLGIRCMIC